MIQARNIYKSFDQLQVLKGIDLDIEQGEVVSIVGRSGAGKTTLLQILGTLDKPDLGFKPKEGEKIVYNPEIIINGTDVLRLKDKALSTFRNPMNVPPIAPTSSRAARSSVWPWLVP